MTALTTSWFEFLESRGARFSPPASVGFGDSGAELTAARSGNVIAPLAHLSTLGFTGADAGTFLQGQLSCDVEGLAPDQATLGCYCTPQGRMLANFLLWRDGDALRVALAGDVSSAVEKRLRMFVLRSKVEIANIDAQLVLLGVAGSGGVRALQEAIGTVPAKPMDLRSVDGVTAVRLRGEQLLVAAPAQHAPELWQQLCATLTPIGTAAWQWLDIIAGVPLVTGPTQDRFVPQMANLELIGGINFRKGCYTGQEVIARAQYRGKVKRRMYLAHVVGAEAHAGDEVVGGGEPTGGMIVNAAPSPEGGYDVLAVLQDAAVAAGDLRLGAADGPQLEIRALPYGVE